MKPMLVLVASLTISGTALAQGPDQLPAPAPVKASPAQAKAKYSLPFAMRPGAPPNLLRIDAPIAVQHAGIEWWDTLMRTPHGVRLVRIDHGATLAAL